MMGPEDISKLERLAALRDRGGLTAEEFEQQKAAILSGPARPPRTALLIGAAVLLALAVVTAATLRMTAPGPVEASSGMGQGIMEESVRLVLLADRIADVREVTEDVELSYDDAGKPGTCVMTGRIAPMAYGKSFRIDYSGSWKGRTVLPVDGYGAKSDVELWKKCPDDTE